MRIIPYTDIPKHDFNVTNIIALHQTWEANDVYHYHSVPRPNSALILFLTNHATYICNDGSFIKPEYGDLLFLPRGSYYSAHFTEKGGTTLLINFNLFDQQNQEIVFSDQIICLAHNCTDILKNTFQELCQIYATTTNNKIILKSKLYSLLNDLAQFCFMDKNARSLSVAVAFINANLTNDFKISELAHMCAMSESTFRREFHKKFGCSPVKYITNEKLQKARQLLQFSELSNDEIGAMLGFYDNAHFIKTFSSATGTTPAQYRNHFSTNIVR